MILVTKTKDGELTLRNPGGVQKLVSPTQNNPDVPVTDKSKKPYDGPALAKALEEVFENFSGR